MFNKICDIKLINENIDKVNWFNLLNMDNIEKGMNCFLHKIDKILQNTASNTAVV